MIWGAMSYNGLGRIRLLEKGEKMNQVVYKIFLETKLQWSIRDLYGNNQVVFQDDNTPCHRAKSPDINLIEKLWADVGAVVR